VLHGKQLPERQGPRWDRQVQLGLLLLLLLLLQ
jgi:hypothetical protein